MSMFEFQVVKGFLCCNFFCVMVLVGGGFVFGVCIDSEIFVVIVDFDIVFNVFICILLNDLVEIVVQNFEIGQGVKIMLLMFIVEEFDVLWSNVCVV